MSRNPILNDRAFAPQPTRSPAEEWQAAQQMGTAQGTAWGPQQQQQRQGWGQPQAEPQGWGQPQPQPYHAPEQPQTAPPHTFTGRTMSLGGVSSAALIIFAFLLVGAWFGWGQVTEGAPVMTEDGLQATAEISSPVLFFGALILGFIVAMVTAFKPTIARFTAIPYGLLQGVVLGMLSHFFDISYPGIVIQAMLATFGVFLVMLVLYGLRILRATPKFVKGVIGATFGIMLMYVAGWVISMFSSSFVPFWHSSGPLGILISVVVVGIAALNLILDFDFIEQGSQNKLPAHMDWYAAFGLMVTMIWLYIEMLRLIAKLRE